MASKKILVLTGGGLASALNSLIEGVINQAKELGWEIKGGLHGWLSLMREGRQIDLSTFDTAMIHNIGGNFLRSSRFNPIKTIDGIDQIKTTLSQNNLDAIIAIGGNDTLFTAKVLANQYHLPVIGVPKTVDNDLSGTYWTPGYPSAVASYANYVRRIRNHAAYDLNRIFVVEAPGYDAGWIAAGAAFGQADVIIPSEKIINSKNLLSLIKERYETNGRYALVAVAQHAQFDQEIKGFIDTQTDLFDTKRSYFVCLPLADYIKKELGIETRALYPGNLLEAADINPVDRDLSIALGRQAVLLAAGEQFGRATCLLRPDWNNKDIHVNDCPLEDMTGDDRYLRLDDSLFDFDALRVKQKFFDYLAPALGVPPTDDDDYGRLQKRISAM